MSFMHKFNLRQVLAVTLLALIFSSCQTPEATHEPRIETPALPVYASPTATAKAGTALEEEAQQFSHPTLTPIEAESPFCTDAEENLFLTACENGTLIVTRSPDPRKMDIFLKREIPFSAEAVSIETSIISTPPEGQLLDQNQYGIYFLSGEDEYVAVRIAGQFFNFERWSAEENLKITSRYNRVFSPYLMPAGKSNYLKLICTERMCDLYINNELAGRLPEGGSGGFERIGLFTAADWDQSFGRVVFNGFQSTKLSPDQLDQTIYQLTDDLTADHKTFSGVGLSGAFNNYEEDGFHFSPIVPFNFYSAATGTSLSDVSIEATVKMEVKPGVSGTQLAGVVCRTSREGSYIAAIKVDGTYTVFRDTPQQPFAVLAHKASDAILPGLAANRLRLDCRGNQIDLYINDRQVESLTDSRYNLSFGRAGLFTKAGSEPNEDAIVFSNLIITELR